MPNKMERFTQRARRALSLAQEEAERLHHDSIGTEHLLLGLIREDEGVAHQALRDLNVDYFQVFDLVPELSQIEQRNPDKLLDLSANTKHVIEHAIVESRRMGHTYIGTEHLLLALVDKPDAIMATLLNRLQITADDIRRDIDRILGLDAPNILRKQFDPHLTSRIRSGSMMRMMPGALPFSLPTNVEAMKILQLIEDGKITAEQGESLLKALPPTGFPTPQGWMQIAKQEREHETRNLRIVISDKRTNAVHLDFTLPVQQVQAGLQNLLGAIEAGTAHYLQYLDSADEAYRMDIYMDESDKQSGEEAS